MERAAFLEACDRDGQVEPTDALSALRDRMRDAIREQIAVDDPPEVWVAASRLLDAGLDVPKVLNQLVLAWYSAMLRDGGEYREALDRLPVPGAEEVESAIIEIVRVHQPISADDVDEAAAERLGLDLDDPVAEALLDRVQEELLGDSLEMLPPDLLVHVPSFTAEVVLTHWVTEWEAENRVFDAAADLAGFGYRDLRWQGADVDAYVGEDGESRWIWNESAELTAGSLVAIRVAEDGEITMTELAESPPVPPELVTALRAGYEVEIAEPGMPVTAQELVLGVLVRDRKAFAQPVAPLTELAAAAGLERRGDLFAHDDSLWRRERTTSRMREVFERHGFSPQARAAIRALALLEDGVPDNATARETLRALYDPDVLDIAADYLIDEPGLGSLAERLLAAASRADERAVAHWLAALAAERRGEVLEAESHLRSADRADPGWPIAQDRLAWYESDRGDAAAAVDRWHRLGFTAEDSDDLDIVEPFAKRTTGPEPGRNEPCWCGSGRKYKACHLGKPALAPLSDRVIWLCRKAMAYLERRGNLLDEVAELASVRAGGSDDPGALADALGDSQVFDTLLHRCGWFEQFLADRGPLLPDDEVLMGQAWTLVDRTVCEVLDAVPGSSVTVRDLRTGDEIEVLERSFSRGAQPGMLACARVVSDGESYHFIGGLFPVAPGTESELLDVLDSDDELELLAYLAHLDRPPRLTTPEGDPLLDCRAVLEVPDPAAARAALDDRYEPDEEGWTRQVAEGPMGTRLLASLQLDGSDLTVTTMSGPRLDAVLAELGDALPGATVRSDEREPLRLDGPPADGPAGVDVPPEVILEVIERYENVWCDESIPALGGRTPRDAVADPTRREQVVRLIASFPEVDPATGAFGLRPARLRELLGLD